MSGVGAEDGAELGSVLRPELLPGSGSGLTLVPWPGLVLRPGMWLKSVMSLVGAQSHTGAGSETRAEA